MATSPGPSTPTLPASSAIPAPYTTTTTKPSENFNFPPYTLFPPFYTLQLNLTTRARQLDLWSTLLTTYYAHHHLFRLNLSTPPPDLFTSPTKARSLSPTNIRILLDHLASTGKVEWIPAATKGQESHAVWVWWKSAGEWADEVDGWVERTGQKGGVVTVYELLEEEDGAVRGRSWVGMEETMLRKVLGILVKRGKAQVFGEAEGGGVKFF
ncbi:ESCRT-II complex, vps25 subunit [Teratosphaeria nubilosa]|uniref:ESCRT-II complex, vps25 subunit n=1 Tax=Teratosphaeria nubilosa TaxID=161662 RepID=A0A6G1LFJ8_9PEZI|nr:ESCRT-II complex, vps25 subunit [Teratosphaeria nubilosa]